MQASDNLIPEYIDALRMLSGAGLPTDEVKPQNNYNQVAEKAVEKIEEKIWFFPLDANFLSISIMAGFNAAFATLLTWMDPSTRLNLVAEIEMASFMLMGILYTLLKMCSENALNILKFSQKLLIAFCSSTVFAYDTICRMAAIYWAYSLPMDSEVDNVLIGLSLGALSLGALISYCQNYLTPDAFFNKLTGALATAFSAANIVSNIDRLWKFSNPESYLNNPNRGEMFDWAALGVGAVFAGISLCFSKKGILGKVFGPLAYTMYSIGTIIESYSYEATTAKTLFYAKGAACLGLFAVNKYCNQPIDTPLARPLLQRDAEANPNLANSPV